MQLFDDLGHIGLIAEVAAPRGMGGRRLVAVVGAGLFGSAFSPEVAIGENRL